MSVAYYRFKMRLTTVVVDHMRHFCDGCNVVLDATLRPLRRLRARVAGEAPWVSYMMVPVLLMAPTLVLRARLWAHYDMDDRGACEEERVRLCLQKGIDPYPTIRCKEYTHGNLTTAHGSESERPIEAAWEYVLVEDMRRRREELRAAVGGGANDSMVKLRALSKRHQAAEMARLIDQGDGYVTSLRLQAGRPDANVLKT